MTASNRGPSDPTLRIIRASWFLRREIKLVVAICLIVIVAIFVPMVVRSGGGGPFAPAELRDMGGLPLKPNGGR